MKAVKNAVCTTIVIASLTTAHASLANAAPDAITSETASAPTTTAAAEPTVSDAALNHILKMSRDKSATTNVARVWVQLGDPWVQWRGQVKRAIDDTLPTGDVFQSFGEAQS